VRATLSHYPKDWKEDEGVKASAMEHWVNTLAPFSKKSIEHALHSYVQSMSTSAPTPAHIRDRAKAAETEGAIGYGDRSSLNMDDHFHLNEQVLPTARRWMEKYPPRDPLSEAGKQTLIYCG